VPEFTKFASFPIDESYLFAAIRYVELNPVRAEIVNDPGVYYWTGVDDKLIKVTSYLKPLGIGENFCYSGINEKEYRRTVPHKRTGRLLGSERFVK
jgi:putative transposase